MPCLQRVPLCLSDSISSQVPAIKNNFNSSASGCFQNPNIGHASIRSTSTWTDLSEEMFETAAPIYREAFAKSGMTVS